MNIQTISSTANPKVKFVLSLQKSSERKKNGLFVIEGIKEIQKAVLNNFEFESVFFCNTIIDENSLKELFKHQLPATVFEVSKTVYDKIAYRENSGGVIAVGKIKNQTLNDFLLPNIPCILVAESVEKPGNLGAILRTADASGVDAVFLCDETTDIYNPNVIRASLGCVFSLPIFSMSSLDAFAWLKNKQVNIFTTFMEESIPHYQADFKLPAAIVMGKESSGVSQVWKDNTIQNISIPMKGDADSLNVSTATAIILFEIVRQRNLI
jgi:RNA methyltransferase, TrmH family